MTLCFDNGENKNLFSQILVSGSAEKVKVNDYVIKQLRQTKAQRVSVRVQWVTSRNEGNDIN